MNRQNDFETGLTRDERYILNKIHFEYIERIEKQMQDCKKGLHSSRGKFRFDEEEWQCDYCKAIIRKIPSTNTMPVNQ